MDGINGIAGLTGVMGFGLLAVYFYLFGGPAGLVTVAVCLSLACLGFLPFNFPKARVFMGDVGSILLGAVFGAMVYRGTNSLLDFICLASFLFPFYADELTTMFVRIKDGENLTRPHRRHIYQLLANEKHLPHWQVTVLYACLQLLVGLTVLALRPRGLPWVLPALAVFFAVFTAVGAYIRCSLPETRNPLPISSPGPTH